LYLRRLVKWFFLLVVVPLKAQQPGGSAFTVFTKANGLSHDYVTTLSRIQTGFIWIATAAGLNRFNGSQFVNFHSNDDPSSLPSEEYGAQHGLAKTASVYLHPDFTC
jgi:ligand-binding sensor domain-containing protein